MIGTVAPETSPNKNKNRYCLRGGRGGVQTLTPGRKSLTKKRSHIVFYSLAEQSDFITHPDMDAWDNVWLYALLAISVPSILCDTL